jgi:hypothetical protein
MHWSYAKIILLAGFAGQGDPYQDAIYKQIDLVQNKSKLLLKIIFVQHMNITTIFN